MLIYYILMAWREIVLRQEFCEAIWHSAMSTAPAELIRLEKQAISRKKELARRYYHYHYHYHYY